MTEEQTDELSGPSDDTSKYLEEIFEKLQLMQKDLNAKVDVTDMNEQNKKYVVQYFQDIQVILKETIEVFDKDPFCKMPWGKLMVAEFELMVEESRGTFMGEFPDAVSYDDIVEGKKKRDQVRMKCKETLARALAHTAAHIVEICKKDGVPLQKVEEVLKATIHVCKVKFGEEIPPEVLELKRKLEAQGKKVDVINMDDVPDSDEQEHIEKVKEMLKEAPPEMVSHYREGHNCAECTRENCPLSGLNWEENQEDKDSNGFSPLDQHAKEIMYD